MKRISRACLISGLLALPVPLALAWQYTLTGVGNGDDKAFAVAIDPSGNVIAAGSVTLAPQGTGFTVVKLSGSRGKELWRREIQGNALEKREFSDQAFDVATDPAGDIVAAGVTQSLETGYDFTVAKLAGKDGSELWRKAIHGTDPNYQAVAFVVAIDPNGDVVAGGFVGDLAAS